MRKTLKNLLMTGLVGVGTMLPSGAIDEKDLQDYKRMIKEMHEKAKSGRIILKDGETNYRISNWADNSLEFEVWKGKTGTRMTDYGLDGISKDTDSFCNLYDTSSEAPKGTAYSDVVQPIKIDDKKIDEYYLQVKHVHDRFFK